MTTPNDDLQRWKGVFPAVPTAFNSDDTINEAGNRAILEDNIAHGVHGFWNCGGTGEGAILILPHEPSTDRRERRPATGEAAIEGLGSTA